MASETQQQEPEWLPDVAPAASMEAPTEDARPMLGEWYDEPGADIAPRRRGLAGGTRFDDRLRVWQAWEGAWCWLVFDERSVLARNDESAKTQADAERECDAAALAWYRLPVASSTSESPCAVPGREVMHDQSIADERAMHEAAPDADSITEAGRERQIIAALRHLVAHIESLGAIDVPLLPRIDRLTFGELTAVSAAFGVDCFIDRGPVDRWALRLADDRLVVYGPAVRA